MNGHSVNYSKMGDLLRGSGYSLQANRKMLEAIDHPDRKPVAQLQRKPSMSEVLHLPIP